ncbi:MAG TPA: chromate efflux transporter [Thermoanaerobaculia bacterium]|nr:chromate efflux transporter [Thermoanaerobaculia bacterium]
MREFHQDASPIPFREALRVWTLVAIQSFGGPAGQIAVMHRILVEEKRWVSESRFLHALNYCMLLPGPEAQQLAIYIGWLLNRALGGLAAGILFVLPGFLSILTLSILYATYGDTTFVSGLFFGLKPAVMAVVVEAVFRIGRRTLKTRVLQTMAGAAFIAIFFLDVPFPVIVAAAGLAGWLGGRLMPEQFPGAQPHAPGGAHGTEVVPVADSLVHQVQPSLGRSLRVLAVGLTLWFLPLLALIALFGSEHVLVQQGIFFSKAAVVTFGGAYAVLAYVGQQAVETYGWLRPGEMLDGLGMAETTPGPLIMVLQFVGFMGAYRLAEGLDPLTAGILGSIVTTWVTFVPCFLWIFLGAPYIERLRGNRSLSTALTGITAAVVGVVLNLAVWFSLHTLFSQVDEVRRLGMRLLVPVWSTLDPTALVIAAFAFLALFRWKLGMLKTLAASAAAGLVWVLVVRPLLGG